MMLGEEKFQHDTTKESAKTILSFVHSFILLNRGVVSDFNLYKSNEPK